MNNTRTIRDIADDLSAVSIRDKMSYGRLDTFIDAKAIITVSDKAIDAFLKHYAKQGLPAGVTLIRDNTTGALSVQIKRPELLTSDDFLRIGALIKR